MGLLRMAARTAVVAGTATAVSGRVARRQNERWAAQDQAEYEQQMGQQAMAQQQYDAQQAAQPASDPNADLQNLAKLHSQDVPTNEKVAAAKAKILGIYPRRRVRLVDAYTRLAGVYDEVVVDPCHRALAGFLDELFGADEEAVAGVLDVCCGTGLLAAELAALGYRV